MSVDILPAEMQEKVLQEVIKQKVEDKKKMGWGKIFKYITCSICEEAKKGVRIEDDSEFWKEPRPEDLAEMPNQLIRPSKVYIIKCSGCGINLEKGETTMYPVTTVRNVCEKPKDAIYSPSRKWEYEYRYHFWCCGFESLPKNEKIKRIVDIMLEENKKFISAIELLEKFDVNTVSVFPKREAS